MNKINKKFFENDQSSNLYSGYLNIGYLNIGYLNMGYLIWDT